MTEESICGGRGCMVHVLSVDLKYIKEDVTEVKETQVQLMKMMSEQQVLSTQINNLQKEVDRLRNSQEMAIEIIAKDIKEMDRGKLSKKDLIIFITASSFSFGVIFSILNLIFRLTVK